MLALALRRNHKFPLQVLPSYLARSVPKPCHNWILTKNQLSRPQNYHFSTSCCWKSNGTAKNGQLDSSESASQSVVYNGPLTRTFRSLKIFSLSSLGLAASLTPFMFIIETSLPFVARVALASTAIATSTVSTALVAWCGQPYVSTIRLLSDPTKNAKEGSEAGIQLETFDLALRSRFTNVYDPAFLTETRRPFSKWELAEQVSMGRSGDAEALSEEVVAETMDASGKVLGRWIVSWNDNGTVGTCRADGKVQRHFNVHEELIPPSVR